MLAYISFYLSPVNVLKTTGLFAFIGIGFAFLDNFGRALDKKRKTPEFEYNYAYLGSTIIAAIVIGLSILGMEATSLGIHEILIAVGYGMGLNLTVKEGTKGTR